MIELKISHFFNGDVENINTIGHRLYIVEYDGVYFYVGQSGGDVINRIYEHLGEGVFGWAGPSRFGEFILQNAPVSKDFKVTILRPSEVDQNADFSTVNRTEGLLIGRLSPCFNVVGNLTPSELPKRYIDPRAQGAITPEMWEVTDRLGRLMFGEPEPLESTPDSE